MSVLNADSEISSEIDSKSSSSFATSPCAVRVHRKRDRVLQACHIYVGREFTLGGWHLTGHRKWHMGQRNLCEFKQYVRDTLWDELDELTGLVLGSLSFDPAACPAHVLVALWREKHPLHVIDPHLADRYYYPTGRHDPHGDMRTVDKPNYQRLPVYRSVKTHPLGLRDAREMYLWPEVQPSIIFVDEAGCGCWAGPLYVCAVLLLPGFDIVGRLHDSKLLHEHERRRLYRELVASPHIMYHVEHVSNRQIDHYGKGHAWRRGVAHAITALYNECQERKVTVANYAVLDGQENIGSERIPIELRLRVKGDRHYAGVAAASILAKVSRDQYMMSLAERYPKFYDIFYSGKGYRYSPEHDKLLAQGLYTDLHRQSYQPLKSVLQRSS